MIGAQAHAAQFATFGWTLAERKLAQRPKAIGRFRKLPWAHDFNVQISQRP
jgi:hypothetical protein